MWKSSTFEHYTSITPSSTANKGAASLTGQVCSMPTYLNKIFVGKGDGAVDIWNVSTGKLMYTLLPSTSTSGPVTALEPTPALSILAIAHADGSLHLRHVRKDKSVIRLKSNLREGTISSISFRTDGLGAGKDGKQPGIMATATRNSGDITFWDLNNSGRVRGVLHNAHNPPSPSGEGGGINRVEFLPGQDVILTGGMDNALKSWIFDANSLSPTPRILHSRSGHGAPVIRLDFVPSDSDGADTTGKWLMSAGRDRSLWGWSLRRDGQSTELSQGNVKHKAKKLGMQTNGSDHGPSTTIDDLKAPEITFMACCMNRDGGIGAAAGGGSVWSNTNSRKNPSAEEIAATGWESVVTAHRGDNCARTWFWGRKKAGRWVFESDDGTEVTSVAISPCGTFALIGSAGGSLSMFNLQSGILRQKFPAPLTPAEARKIKITSTKADTPTTVTQVNTGKHRKAITGICVDNINRKVISAGLDGCIKFWDFSDGQLISEINWSGACSISSLQLHRPNDLIALTCEDGAIRLVDIETKKRVRELWGCIGQISSCTFSNDGRWIIAASMDSVIRTWDLPTGHLINAFRVSSPCTSIAFSDTGEYLATAHADSVGINIWNNRTLFTHVPTGLIREDEIIETATPTSSGENGQSLIEAAFEEPTQDIPDHDPSHLLSHTSPDSSQSLTALTVIPKSRYELLLNLDLVRARNKPLQPPKKPEKAPFFLPTVSAQPTFSDPKPPSSGSNNASLTPSELKTVRSDAKQTREFSALLAAGHDSGDFRAFILHIARMTPSELEISILTLNIPEMTKFVRALIWGADNSVHFRVLQASLRTFLRAHAEVVKVGSGGETTVLDAEDAGKEEIRKALREWQVAEARAAARLRTRVAAALAKVNWLLEDV